MAKNCAVRSITLPCSACTDVQNKNNWIYDLTTPESSHPAPTDIPVQDNEGGPTDDEYDQMKHNAPGISKHATRAHTTPGPSHTFAGTSFRHQSREEYDSVTIRTALDNNPLRATTL